MSAIGAPIWLKDLARTPRELVRAFWPGKIAISDVELGQLRFVAQLQMSISPSVVVVYLAFALCFLSWVHPSVIAAWTAAITIMHLVVRGSAKELLERLDGASSDSPDAPRMERRLRLSFFFYNLCVASYAMLFWVPDLTANHELILAALAFSAAPILVLTSGYRPIFLVSIMPIAVIGTIRLIFHDDMTNPLAPLLFIGGAFVVLQLSNVIFRGSSVFHALEEDRSSLIDELYKEKTALERARYQAENASQAKSDFLAQMSHELRTPLNAIIGFSEIMMRETFGGHSHPNYLGYSADIHSSGEHLLCLINDILDLSRIESGRMDLREEEIDVAALAHGCCRSVELQAAERGITLKEVFSDNLPLVFADERAIRQTLLNLLTNAIKFSGPGAVVTLRLQLEPSGELLMGVYDTGCGILETEVGEVMESFVQGTAGKTQPGRGSGLGLPIVKGLIETHGGVFRLTSQVGQGTQAEALLPPHRLRRRTAESIA